MIYGVGYVSTLCVCIIQVNEGLSTFKERLIYVRKDDENIILSIGLLGLGMKCLWISVDPEQVHLVMSKLGGRDSDCHYHVIRMWMLRIPVKFLRHCTRAFSLPYQTYRICSGFILTRQDKFDFPEYV